MCRLPATEGNGFERRDLSSNLGFNRLNSGGSVWTKILLLNEQNEPLISGIAHVIVKIESTNLSEESFTVNTNNVTVFEQRTTQYPEIPVKEIYFFFSNFFYRV